MIILQIVVSLASQVCRGQMIMTSHYQMPLHSVLGSPNHKRNLRGQNDFVGDLKWNFNNCLQGTINGIEAFVQEDKRNFMDRTIILGGEKIQ